MKIIKKMLRIRLLIILLILIGLGVVYFLVISQYQQETLRRNSSLYKSSNLNNPQQEYLSIVATVQGIDAVQKDFKLRLDYIPSEGLSSDGLSPKKDLKLFINNAVGQREFTLKKNEIPQAQDIVLQMFDGQVSNYPFDVYNVELVILVTEVPPENQPTNLIPISLDLNLFSSLANYQINSQPSKEVGNEYILSTLQVNRSPSTIFYFFFIMTIMALISLTAFILSLTLALSPAKIEIGQVRLDLDIFAYLAALLFAFPAIRETMPETPKIGALGDFLVFFWAEGLLAMSLVISVIAWLVRRFQQAQSTSVAAVEPKLYLAEQNGNITKKEPVEPR